MKVFLKGLNTCTQRAGKLRQYRTFLVANGHEIVETLDECDAVVAWTCAFRGDVRDNTLARLKEYESAGHRVIATGCMPDIDPEGLAAGFSGQVFAWTEEAELERLFGRPGGRGLADCEAVFGEPPLCDDLARFRTACPDVDATFPDQFIKLVVAEGCPYTCTYCSERLAFPDFRSFDAEALAAECRRLVAETGRTEVILLADCVGEYGRDTGRDLPWLIRRLCAAHPDLRVALSNFHPINFLQNWAAFSDLIAENRIRHLNLPIQSASDPVLRRMNRLYRRDDLERLFGHLGHLGFDQFDTHIIVGFPGETTADVDTTLDFLVRHRVRYVLINRFMETPGMPATRFADKVPPTEAARRMRDAEDRLRAAGAIVNAEDSDLMRDRMARLNRGRKAQTIAS